MSETSDRTPSFRRVALVTGGARRVGKAICLELARAGCDVAVHYRESRDPARDLVAAIRDLGFNAVAVEGDLTRAENAESIVRATVDQLGGLDVLINNASSFNADGSDNLAGFDADRWRRMFEVNVFAPAALAHAAHPHLRSKGTGCVVNLVDISAERPWPDHLAYCASKAALVNLTRSLARAMAPEVRVNAVAPGIAVFPESYSPAQRDRLVKKAPLQREGSPQDIAAAVRFLVRDAPYVSGQVIPVDGGRSIV